MATQLFRTEVIEASRDRLVGTVVAATPPTSRVYTWLIVAVTLVLALFLAFGSLARHEKVRGVTAFNNGFARVYPPVAATITQIAVRPGQRVAAGQPLATIAPSAGSDAAGAGMASQIAENRRQDEEIARQLALAGTSRDADITALEQQRSSSEATTASLERQLSIAAGQIELAEADVKRTTRLARENAGTQRQVEESKGVLLARRTEREQLAERLIAQRQLSRNLGSQIAQRGVAASQAISALAERRAALSLDRVVLARQDRLVLTAPVAGEIGDISAQVGQRSRPDASVATIIPANSTLEVWLYAPSRAVGFVRPGQTVQLLFDAFPYQKFGAGRGHVVAVSAVPADPGSIATGLGIQEPVFRIRVAIDQASGKSRRQLGALREGMTLSANLVLERRSLWQVFFAPALSAVGA